MSKTSSLTMGHYRPVFNPRLGKWMDDLIKALEGGREWLISFTLDEREIWADLNYGR